jgi:uncharacterized membrane protein required for colicin V production
MILDLIILAIAVILVIIGVVRGIARTLLNVLSVAASAVCTYLGAGLLSNLIYTSIISPEITKNVTNSMADTSASAATVIQEAIDALPEFVVNFLKTFGIVLDNVTKSAVAAVNGSQTDVSGAVDLALKPVITSVLSVILMVLLFIIFLFIFKKIAKRAERLFHIPIVGALNGFLGGVLGLIEAAIIVFVGILVIKVMFVFSQDPFIPMDMISNSIVFGTIYNSGIFNNIAAFFGAGKDIAASASAAATGVASEVEGAVR